MNGLRSQILVSRIFLLIAKRLCLKEITKKVGIMMQ